MAFHQHLKGGPPRNTTSVPLSPYSPPGNLDHLVSLFHTIAVNMGLLAAGFPAITPSIISTLSIEEQLILTLLWASIKMSIHLGAAREAVSTEMHDLS